MTRDNTLKDLRPIISTANVNSQTSIKEAFQNTTLRPIIKFQHELLIAVLKNYFSLNKIFTADLSSDDLNRRIENAVQKDNPFKNQLLGIIISHFTIEEFSTYTGSPNAFNKRITQMIIQRLQNSIDQL